MERSRRFFKHFLRPVPVVLLLLIATSGCLHQISGIAYAIRGDRVKAAYTGLNEKRVAVVCRPPATLQYRNATAARDISRQVSVRLRENLKKKKTVVINHREIDKWVDENDWQDYIEIGEALEADMLVAIDLESFSLQQDSTLYQGRSGISITVYDMANGGEVVFERALPEIIYPSNPTPSVDMSEGDFRQAYIRVLSERIARHFYDYEGTLDFASDSRLL